jgi:polysaccharide export outer membrane protein
MRSLKWAALWAAISLLCFGIEARQQPTAADAAKAPAGVETDPARMASAGTPPPATTDKSYIIGAEDGLTVQVWGDPRLSGAVLVRPDGKISLNLAGEIPAAGLTPSQLEKSIADILRSKEILNRPQVTVQVTAINSKKYYILGEVLKPGPNPLVVPTRVLEALVNAGGFKDFANTRKIEVIRGTQRMKFNYKDVIHGKHTEQNIFLEPGDIITVP